MSDAITTEVIRHGLLAAASEMATNLCRTAYNTVVYEIHDYGIGIHDAQGDVVADAPGIAVFTRGNDHGIKRAVEAALAAKNEHEDLRETVHRLEGLVLQLTKQVQEMRRQQ